MKKVAQIFCLAILLATPAWADEVSSAEEGHDAVEAQVAAENDFGLCYWFQNCMGSTIFDAMVPKSQCRNSMGKSFSPLQFGCENL